VRQEPFFFLIFWWDENWWTCRYLDGSSDTPSPKKIKKKLVVIGNDCNWP